jgi:hypothetical protein
MANKFLIPLSRMAPDDDEVGRAVPARGKNILLRQVLAILGTVRARIQPRCAMKMRKGIIVTLFLVLTTAHFVGRELQLDLRAAAVDTDIAAIDLDQPAPEVRTPSVEAVSSQPAIPSVNPSPPLTPRAPNIERAAELQNVPINFWGKVIDENDQPLSGVSVEIQTRHVQANILHAASALESTRRTTDASGLFAVTGARGDLLTVRSLRKEGYMLASSSLKSFGYNTSANHVPDENSPVTFRMWKQGIAEPLVTFHKSFRVPVDNTPLSIDLLQGRIGEFGGKSADLKISVGRGSDIAKSDSRRFDWTVVIQAINGGVVQASEEGLRAPEAGYQEPVHITNLSLEERWRASRRILVYFNSRDGQCFGRAVLDVIVPTSGPAAVVLDSTTNPRASRNLQPGGPRVAAHAQWSERLAQAQ